MVYTSMTFQLHKGLILPKFDFIEKKIHRLKPMDLPFLQSI